jgi:hypothetical protein
MAFNASLATGLAPVVQRLLHYSSGVGTRRDLISHRALAPGPEAMQGFCSGPLTIIVRSTSLARNLSIPATENSRSKNPALRRIDSGIATLAQDRGLAPGG